MQRVRVIRAILIPKKGLVGWLAGWLVGWFVGWLVGRSGVNFYCMQMSPVMRRRFISSGDFDEAPFFHVFLFVLTP